MGIWTVYKILAHSQIERGGGDPRDFSFNSLNLFYRPIQEYTWFRGGDLDCLQDNSIFSNIKGVGMTPRDSPFISCDLFYCPMIISEDCVCLSLKVFKLYSFENFRK